MTRYIAFAKRSIIANTYKQHIYNSTDNACSSHVYNMLSNPDSEFASAINQGAEISKTMRSIGSVTKSDTTCEFFSHPIIGQMEEL